MLDQLATRVSTTAQCGNNARRQALDLPERIPPAAEVPYADTRERRS